MLILQLVCNFVIYKEKLWQCINKWSIDLSGDFNFWDLSHDRKWKHWTVMPEARYWLCDALGGHFFGAHLLEGEFNVGNLDLPFSFLGSDFRQLRDNRFQGWRAGVGTAYPAEYTTLLNRYASQEAQSPNVYI